MSQTLECPNCGAAIDYHPGSDPVVRCRYCQTAVIIPDELSRPSEKAQLIDITEVLWSEDLFQPEKIASIQEIARLARQGNSIEAIKLYRQVFAVSLDEAHSAVQALQTGGMARIYYNLQAAQDPEEIKTEISRLIAEKDKIGAIRYYRQVTQRGLKEAKIAVEQFENNGILNLPGEADGQWSSGSVSSAIQQANQLVAVIELVAAGDKIGAIQAYQAAFGTSLVDAQEAIHKISLGVTEDHIPVSVQTIQFSSPSKSAAAATAGVLGGISCVGLLGSLAILLVILVPLLFALASPGGPLEGVWNRINPLAYARVVSAFGEQGSGSGYLDDPRGLAIDPQGSLYIANYDDGRVQKFSSTGAYQMLWNIGPDQYVSSMAADRSGNIFLVYDGDIWQYDGSSGQLLGKLADDLDVWFEAVAATADGGLVAAVDSEQIYRFAANGDLAFSLANVLATQTGDPEGVEAIAVDGLGNLFVLTDGDIPVLIYSPQGRLLARFGSLGNERGQLRAPSAIAIDGQGRIYISDIKGLQVFAGDGRYLDKIEIQGFAHGLAFDQQGDLWAVSNLPRVFEYQISGR